MTWLPGRLPVLVTSTGTVRVSSRGMSKRRAPVRGFCVNTVETTGAGDTFFGGVLHHVLTWGLRDYTQEELAQMLTFANAAAAIITTKKGALRVMPEKADILALLSR